MTFRSGYVALVGRPNVGKSTLLNQILGQKIAATTHKPQTTRRNLLGILTEDDFQILFLDTPGHHRAKGPLNHFMVNQAESAIEDADVICWVVEPRRDGKVTPGNDRVLNRVLRSKKRVVLAVNKTDLVKDKTALLPFLEAYSAVLQDSLVAAIPISALKKKGLERLVKELGQALPEGPQHFPADELTDVGERAVVAEMVREKIIILTEQEVPYSVSVSVDKFVDERPRIIRIFASIAVERDSQKGILIGKKGATLKAIGQRARKDIEYFVGSQVYLELRVYVDPNWSEDSRSLRRLGYTAEAGPLGESLA